MRGQFFSLDSLAAFAIFFLIMGMIAFLWIDVSLLPTFEIQQKANDLADLLVTSKMADDNTLNCSKLFDFTLEDYDDLKQELNIGAYDFWIEFEGIDSTICPDIRPDIDVMLVLDVSGSMGTQTGNEDRIRNLTNASKTFIDQLNETYDHAGVVSYSTNSNVEFGLLSMTDTNKTTVKGQACIEGSCGSCGPGLNQICCGDSYDGGCSGDMIDDCEDCSGGTNIGDGILEAVTELNKGRGFPPVFKIQVLISDGNPTYPQWPGWSTEPEDIQHSLDAAYEACLNDSIIYTISLGDDANQTLMEEISDKTYGKHYYAPTPQDLQEIFVNISKEIAVTSDYGKQPSVNVKNIATVVRYLKAGNKILKVNVRIFEYVEGGVTVCV